jgi:FMN reductase
MAADIVHSGGQQFRYASDGRSVRPCVAAVNGSPAYRSRLAQMLAHLADCLERLGCRVDTLHLREIPPEILLGPPTSGPPREHWSTLGTADLVVLGSPIYKSVYSGLLKCWLDHLPRNGFEARLVLPVATCHDPNDARAFTDSLRQVCASMGAARLLPTIVLPSHGPKGHHSPSSIGRARLERAVQDAVRAVVEHTGVRVT